MAITSPVVALLEQAIEVRPLQEHLRRPQVFEAETDAKSMAVAECLESVSQLAALLTQDRRESLSFK